MGFIFIMLRYKIKNKLNIGPSYCPLFRFAPFVTEWKPNLFFFCFILEPLKSIFGQTMEFDQLEVGKHGSTAQDNIAE